MAKGEGVVIELWKGSQLERSTGRKLDKYCVQMSNGNTVWIYDVDMVKILSIGDHVWVKSLRQKGEIVLVCELNYFVKLGDGNIYEGPCTNFLKVPSPIPAPIPTPIQGLRSGPLRKTTRTTTQSLRSGPLQKTTRTTTQSLRSGPLQKATSAQVPLQKATSTTTRSPTFCLQDKVLIKIWNEKGTIVGRSAMKPGEYQVQLLDGSLHGIHHGDLTKL